MKCMKCRWCRCYAMQIVHTKVPVWAKRREMYFSELQFSQHTVWEDAWLLLSSEQLQICNREIWKTDAGERGKACLHADIKNKNCLAKNVHQKSTTKIGLSSFCKEFNLGKINFNYCWFSKRSFCSNNFLWEKSSFCLFADVGSDNPRLRIKTTLYKT